MGVRNPKGQTFSHCRWSISCCSLSSYFYPSVISFSVHIIPLKKVKIYTECPHMYSPSIVFDSNPQTANIQTWAPLLMCRKRCCVPVNLIPHLFGGNPNISQYRALSVHHLPPSPSPLLPKNGPLKRPSLSGAATPKALI